MLPKLPSWTPVRGSRDSTYAEPVTGKRLRVSSRRSCRQPGSGAAARGRVSRRELSSHR